MNEIEMSYPFDLELEDGTKETIKVPRFTTRMKYKLGMRIQHLKVLKEEDIAEVLIDMVLPGLMDRSGEKAPTMLALGTLTSKIIDMDGETIFGRDWQKKLHPEKKKRGRKKKTG